MEKQVTKFVRNSKSLADFSILLIHNDRPPKLRGFGGQGNEHP